jgi:hypothetical protein
MARIRGSHAGRLSPAMVVAVLALIVAIGGVAAASIPGAGGVIQGCYDPTAAAPHALSVVDATSDCRSPSVLLPFNQQGPAGAQGAKGDQGPQGPHGLSTVYTTLPVIPTYGLTVAKKMRTIARLRVPGGKYLVIAKATVDAGAWGDFSLYEDKYQKIYSANSTASSECSLPEGDGDVAALDIGVGAASTANVAVFGGSATTMTLTTTVDFPLRGADAFDIVLRCGHAKPFAVAMTDVHLTAVGVDEIVRQPSLVLHGSKPKPKFVHLPYLKGPKRKTIKIKRP